MGNVVFRYIGCADTETIEYSREGRADTDDNIKLVDHLEFVELEFNNA